MLTFRGRVQYNDGTTAEFVGGTALMAAYEAYALRNGLPIGEGMPPTTSAMVMAHAALGISEGFDLWRKDVFGVELEAEGIPPTPEARSDE